MATGRGSALAAAIKAEQWRVNGNFKMTPLRWALRRVNRQQGSRVSVQRDSGTGLPPAVINWIRRDPALHASDKCDAKRSNGASSEIELSIDAMHFRVQLETVCI